MPELLRAYPLRFTSSPALLAGAGAVLPATQAALSASWTEAAFDRFLHAGQEHAEAVLARLAEDPTRAASQKQPSPKALQGRAWQVAAANGLLPVEPSLPSRVTRAVQEVAGRMLRSQAERRGVYGLFRLEDGALACRLDARDRYRDLAEPLVARNVAEAMVNWLREHECDPLPAAYTEFQAAPTLHTAILTAAADDGPANGQFIRYGTAGIANELLWFQVKTPGQDSAWQWSPPHGLFPAVHRARQAGRRLEPGCPDIRVKPDGRAFFDLKLRLAVPKRPTFTERPAQRVLGVDWNVKHLVVMQAVEGAAHGGFAAHGGVVRLVLPVFLHEDGLLAKLENIRTHARRCQSRAARFLDEAATALENDDPACALRLLTRSLAYLNEKRTLWAKFRRIQKTLAQNAAQAIVRRALALGCDTISIEALGGLRSREKGPRINWKVNAQIRTFTHQRVEELAAEHGLRVKLVSAKGTSLSCPECRVLGVRALSPDHHQAVLGGPWFQCSGCGYNASADYVAATNIALLGAHARKGQRVTDMPAVQRPPAAEQWRTISSRLERLRAKRAAAIPAAQPAPTRRITSIRLPSTRRRPIRARGSVLPFPLAVAPRLSKRHPGYPGRIKLSQQRTNTPPLAA